VPQLARTHAAKTHRPPPGNQVPLLTGNQAHQMYETASSRTYSYDIYTGTTLDMLAAVWAQWALHDAPCVQPHHHHRLKARSKVQNTGARCSAHKGRPTITNQQAACCKA